MVIYFEKDELVEENSRAIVTEDDQDEDDQAPNVVALSPCFFKAALSCQACASGRFCPRRGNGHAFVYLVVEVVDRRHSGCILVPSSADTRSPEVFDLFQPESRLVQLRRPALGTTV